jgi:hypothetical protein
VVLVVSLVPFLLRAAQQRLLPQALQFRGVLVTVVLKTLRVAMVILAAAVAVIQTKLAQLRLVLQFLVVLVVQLHLLPL